MDSARARGVGTTSGLFRLPLLLIALLAGAGFGVDSFIALGSQVSSFDVSLERDVQAAAWGPLVTVFAALDWFEGLKQVAAAVLGLVVVAVWSRRALPLMIWGALSGAAYQVTEMLVRRPRPDAHLVHVIRHTSGFSFPSGHELFFTWFTAYLLLIFGRRLPRPVRIAGWTLIAALLAVVGVGRVYEAEHWPTDVLAGLLLGIAWAAIGLSIRPLSKPVFDA